VRTHGDAAVVNVAAIPRDAAGVEGNGFLTSNNPPIDMVLL